MWQSCLQECTGELDLADALISLLGLLPKAEWMLTTLGTRGSVLLQRHAQDVEAVKVSLHSFAPSQMPMYHTQTKAEERRI